MLCTMLIALNVLHVAVYCKRSLAFTSNGTKAESHILKSLTQTKTSEERIKEKRNISRDSLQVARHMADIVCCSAFLSIAVVTSITQSWPRQELSIGNKRKQCCSQGGDMSRRRRKLTSSSCFFSLFFIARYFVSSFPRLHVK